MAALFSTGAALAQRPESGVTDPGYNESHCLSRLRFARCSSAEEIAKPVPNDNQVLVKVRAASVNPLDWHYIEGTPYLMRLMGSGLRKPKVTRLGVDYAGTVEAVGQECNAVQARRRGIRRANRGLCRVRVCSREIEQWP